MIEVKLVSEKEEKDFMVRKFELSQESNYVNLATVSLFQRTFDYMYIC